MTFWELMKSCLVAWWTIQIMNIKSSRNSKFIQPITNKAPYYWHRQTKDSNMDFNDFDRPTAILLLIFFFRFTVTFNVSWRTLV